MSSERTTNARSEALFICDRLNGLFNVADSLVSLGQNVRTKQGLGSQRTFIATMTFETHTNERCSHLIDSGDDRSKQRDIILTLNKEVQANSRDFFANVSYLESLAELDWDAYTESCEFTATVLNALVSDLPEVLPGVDQSQYDSLLRAKDNMNEMLQQLIDDFVIWRKRLSAGHSLTKKKSTSSLIIQRLQERLRSFGYRTPQDLVALPSNSVTEPSRNRSQRKRKANELESEADSVGNTNTSPVSISVQCGVTDNPNSARFSLREEFCAFPDDSEEQITSISITLPGIGLTDLMQQNLYSFTQQLHNLKELVFKNEPNTSMCLSEAIKVIQFASPTRLERVVFHGPFSVEADCAAKLGNATALLHSCKSITLGNIEGDVSLNTWLDTQIVLSDRLKIDAVATVSQKTEEDPSYCNVQQTRYERILDLNSGIDNLCEMSSLTSVRIDFEPRLRLKPQSPLLDALVEKLEKLLKSKNLKCIHLTTFRSPPTSRLLGSLLIDLRKFTGSSFSFETREVGTSDLIKTCTPAILKLLKENVYLEHFHVQGETLTLDLEYEEQKTMYLTLNRLGRRLLLNGDEDPQQFEHLITLVGKAGNDVTSIFYFLSYKPSLWVSELVAK